MESKTSFSESVSLITGEDLLLSSLSQLEVNSNIYRYSKPLPSSEKVWQAAKELLVQMRAERIKSTSLLGTTSGCSLAIATAIYGAREIRRLILFQPTVKVAPGRLTKFIDKVEEILPAGLPLRKLSDEFDARPFLHRITCPTLVVTLDDSSSYSLEQAKLIANNIPNAWHMKDFDRNKSQNLSYLVNTIEEFLAIPAKRSQK